MRPVSQQFTLARIDPLLTPVLQFHRRMIDRQVSPVILLLVPFSADFWPSIRYTAGNMCPTSPVQLRVDSVSLPEQFAH
jgi:hypothetical protein